HTTGASNHSHLPGEIRPKSIVSHRSLLLSLLVLARLFARLKQAIDVGCAEGSIVQAVAWLSVLAPDHTAMIRTDVAVKSLLHRCPDDFIHIQAAARGEVRALLKGVVLQAPDVSQMDEG